MTETQKLSLWVYEQMVRMLDSTECEFLDRGEPISEEWNQRGERAAKKFLETLELPENEHDVVALFPRMWGASMFLHNAVNFGTPLPLAEDKKEALSVLMIDVWESQLRGRWEEATV